MSISSALPVFEHRLVSLRRTWRGAVFTSFLLPVMFLLGLGVSVGSYVDGSGDLLGVPYLDFVAPGLLASAMLQIIVGEATWPILSAFEWNRRNHAMRATPLRPADIVGGEFGYLLVRVTVPAVAFLIVMTAFGVTHSWWSLAAVPAAVLGAAAVAGWVLAFSASIRTDNWFALLLRFGVIPMTLFAGVFFPVEQMPLVARWLAYVSPLWHAVALTRAATFGTGSVLPVVGHVGYLALLTIAGYGLARARFARRLAG